MVPIFFPFLFFLPMFMIALTIKAFSPFVRRLFDDTNAPRSSSYWPVAGETRMATRAETGSHESRVYALAYKLGGRITLSDVIIETRLSPGDAEALINGMVDEVRVRMLVDDDKGFVVYEFPEIIDRLEREKGER